MNLEQSIQQLNLAFAPYQLHAFQQPLASDEQIIELQHLSKRSLPNELKRFYREYGGIGYEDEGVMDTGMTIRLLPAHIVILALQDRRKYLRLDSIGIIDWLRYQFDNDWSKLNDHTPEFEQLNSNYIGLGMRQYDHDSAKHIYIDQSGKFGIIDFHPDAFDIFREKYVIPMLKQSPANMTLEEALQELLENPTAPTPI